MEWISVKNEYPKHALIVLVSDGFVVGVSFWDIENLKWLRADVPWEDFNCDVTHWMPLPEPPNPNETNG